MNLNQIAGIELIYKSKGKTTDRPIVKKVEDARRILIDQWDENKTILLNKLSKYCLIARVVC